MCESIWFVVYCNILQPGLANPGLSGHKEEDRRTEPSPGHAGAKRATRGAGEEGGDGGGGGGGVCSSDCPVSVAPASMSADKPE